MELLVLLVAGNGRLVTRAEIAEHLWGHEVFVDTEHGINTAVRKIRQILRDDPEQPRFVETVPSRGYRFIGRIVEISAATDSSEPVPVAEVAAEDTKTLAAGMAGPSASPAMPHRTGARFPRWVLGPLVSVVLISLILATRWNHARRGSAALKIDSLAVLPLDNLSGDSSQDYLAAGMTDELITMLAKNSTLRIVSRTSAMQFKGAHRSLPELARELGVDGIVEGSLSRSAHGLHLTIQLIHAPSDTHIWAESYDRDSNDASSLPGEVARAVAKRLDSAAPSPARERYVRPEAHDDYLRGHYLWFRGHDEQAAEYFKKALELQPDYALAWTGVADVNGAQAFYKSSPKVATRQAKAAALKAVSLDDSLAQAHLSLCMITFSGDWDWSHALQECGRAIELDPKLSEAWHFGSEILAALNRQTEALEWARKAAVLDAFSRPWALPASLLRARQFDAAINEARARLEVDPHQAGELGVLDNAYRAKGMWKEAFESSYKELVLHGNATRASDELHDFQRGGYPAVMQGRLNYWKKQAQSNYVPAYILASLTAQLRQRDETLAFLAQALEDRHPDLVFIQCDPAFDFLHADERYRSIVRRIGLPPAY